MSPAFLVMALSIIRKVPSTGHVPSAGGFWGEITEPGQGWGQHL